MRARRFSPRGWTTPFLEMGMGKSSSIWYLVWIMSRCRRWVPAAEESSIKLLMVFVARRRSEMPRGLIIGTRSAWASFWSESSAATASSCKAWTVFLASMEALSAASPTTTASLGSTSKGPFCSPKPGKLAAEAGPAPEAAAVPAATPESRRLRLDAATASLWPSDTGVTKSHGALRTAAMPAINNTARGEARPARRPEVME
mmetsp:Transcript_137043/g.347201  ORF Transcript_137043/g.347201 Transcript_137043/m.347201 type:complete len:202 (+) Transcript_137043:357-962(+)